MDEAITKLGLNIRRDQKDKVLEIQRLAEELGFDGKILLAKMASQPGNVVCIIFTRYNFLADDSILVQ